MYYVLYSIYENDCIVRTEEHIINATSDTEAKKKANRLAAFIEQSCRDEAPFDLADDPIDWWVIADETRPLNGDEDAGAIDEDTLSAELSEIMLTAALEPETSSELDEPAKKLLSNLQKFLTTGKPGDEDYRKSIQRETWEGLAMAYAYASEHCDHTAMPNPSILFELRARECNGHVRNIIEKGGE